MSSIHYRQYLRDLVVSRLVNDRNVSATIYNNRAFTISVLPAINVLTLNEDVLHELDSFDGLTVQYRELNIELEIISQESDALYVETIVDTVEESLMNCSSLADATFNVALISTQFRSDQSGRNPVRIATMVFAIQYNVDGTDPSYTR